MFPFPFNGQTVVFARLFTKPLAVEYGRQEGHAQGRSAVHAETTIDRAIRRAGTQLQLGVGSGNPGLDSYVDYLAFSNGIESTTWDF